MTHPLTTLEGQQGELITRLPNIINQVHRLLDAVDTDELHRMVQSRLSSGIKVFRHEMFTWEAGDLWSEAVEELADGVLYMLAYMVVADNGPLPPLKDPKKPNSPKAEAGWVPSSGERVRVINERSMFNGQEGVVDYYGSVVIVRDLADSKVHLAFCKHELEPVADHDTIAKNGGLYSTDTGIGW